MTRNLRISLVTETYFPQVNGVSRTLDRLVRYCASQGDRLQLLLPRYGEGTTELPKQVEKSDWMSLPLPFYKEVVLPLVTVAMIEQALQNFHPDVVHIATEGPLGWAALRAAKRLNIPVVSSYHTNFPQYLETYNARPLEPLCWKYLRWFHNNTLATFCPSASTREMIEAKGFDRVDIWSRGVDRHVFNPAKRDLELRRTLGVEPDDILLTYTGRIANEKNLEMLMGAWQYLSGQENTWLLLIGDGPLREKLAARKPPRTIFAGYRYGEELASLYASSDMFVFPSLSETFGNVILEAMASGLPVVAYDVQGPKDIVQPQMTGHLVADIDAESLANAVHELIINRNQRTRMGHLARDYAKTQSWEETMGGMRNRYIGCLSKTGNSLGSIVASAANAASRSTG